MKSTNLIEVFEGLSLSNEKGIYFINSSSEQEFYSYANLYTDAIAFAQNLKLNGVKSQDEIIFQIDDLKEFVQLFWASILGGFIPVPLNSALNPESRNKLNNVWNTLNNPTIVASPNVIKTIYSKLNTNELRGFSESKIIDVNMLKVFSPSEFNSVLLNEDDIALLQFSSGSTGSPKGVKLTHKNLLTNINAIIQGSNLNEQDSTLGWMPLTHDLGLIGFHLTPLFRGIDQYLIPTEIFVRHPSLWIDKIHEHRITFTASPNFGYKHFMHQHNWAEDKKWDLSCLKRILNGAEPISVEICDEFLLKLAKYNLREESMFPVYGMAEASLAITFPDVDQKIDFKCLSQENLGIGQKVKFDSKGLKYISVGKPVENTEVRICNDENIPLSDLVCGHIQIKGDNVTNGYYNNEIQTFETILSSGWLKTGDLGFFDEGKLYITGRAKDIIFSNGLNLYPHDLERLVEKLDKIEEGKVVFSGVFNHSKGEDDIICFVLFRAKNEHFIELVKQIKTHLNKEISIDIEYVIPVKNIPKTTSGKVQRYKLTKDYLEGKFLKAIQTLEFLENVGRSDKLPASETEKKVLAIWNKVLEVSHEGIGNNFFEIGGNSIKASLFSSKATSEFEVIVTIRDLFKNPTVELISKLIDSKSRSAIELIPIVSERNNYPTSTAQKRLFLLHLLNPESLNYNITSIHEIEKEIDIEKVESIFKTLIKKHSILRTNIKEIGGEPVQVINKEILFKVDKIHSQKDLLDDTVKAYIKPYNLSDDRLFKVGYFKTETSQFLVFDIHHIIADGYSLNLLVSEFSDLYNSKELVSKSVRFVDFSSWEPDFLASEEIMRQEKFWLNEFSDEIPILNFPSDYPRTFKKDDIAKTWNDRIESSLYQMMWMHAKKNELTFYMQLLSAFCIVLQKYTDSEDVIVGTPIMNRPHNGISSVLGPFINTVPLRNKPIGAKSIGTFIAEVKENLINAFSNQNYPFELLVDKVKVKRDLDRNPMFDILFVLQNTNNADLNLGNNNVKTYPFTSGHTKFDFNIQLTEKNEGFDIRFEYASEIYKEETISQFVGHFKDVLQQICQLDRDKKIDDISIVASGLVNVSNSTDSLFTELSAKNALDKFYKYSTKDNCTLKFYNTTLNALQIDLISNYYANLLKESGVLPGDFIGIAFNETYKLPIAILAAWKLRASFVPIDPSNPKDRLDFIQSDAQLKFLFTDVLGGDMLSSDIIIENSLVDFKKTEINSDDIAYVIYTSGTTGNPKGVQIKHESLVNYTDWLLNDFTISNNDSSVLISSYAFDLGYTSLFGTLLNGGCIHFVDEKKRKEPSDLIDYFVDESISYIKTTPSQLFGLLNATNSEKLKNAASLRYVFVGGEEIRISDIEKLKNWLPKLTVINHYGPTEATIGCIARNINTVDFEDYSKAPDIGFPIQNVNLQILNQRGQEVPIGVEGELFIGGVCLTKGYFERNTLNKEKFTESGFYSTGDIVKRNHDGSIRLIGRKDGQVKVRGYRIELKGIENTIVEMKSISDAIVIPRKDQDSGVYLSLYYISADKIDAIKVREYLLSKIPDYMVPDVIIQIDAIPLTSNGKVDVSSLPLHRVIESIEEDYKATTSIQIKLVKIWKELLNINDIGINQNFFEVGGHSLKANILASRIHKEFNVEFKLREIFENSSILLQEMVIKAKEHSPFSNIPSILNKEFYETSSSQRRMYVLNQLQPSSTSYNMTGAFVLRPASEINLIKIEAAFIELVKRHESLRTNFKLNNENELVQLVHQHIQFKIQELSETSNLDETIKTFINPFDLENDVLFRVGISKIADSQNYLLIFDIHHIISDGTSMGIIIADFVNLYDNMPLNELVIQYKDYAHWHNELSNSAYNKQLESFWINEFKLDIPILELPSDYKRPLLKKGTGSNFSFEINQEITNEIKSFIEEKNITLFMFLIAVYGLFLSKRTGQSDVVIGTPVAGRSHADLQSIIGVFLNMLPIRLEVEKQNTFINYLETVKEKCLNCFDHQNYSFDSLISTLDLTRDTSRNPLFDTMLVVQNMDLKDLKTNDLDFNQYEFDLGISQLDLSFIVFENENKLDFTVEYSTELFEESTVLLFAEEFQLLLNRILKKPDELLSNIDLNSDYNKSNIITEAYKNVIVRDELTFAHLLQNAIATYGNNTAIVDFESNISFKELGSKIASYQNVLFENGIQKGDVVGVMCLPSFEMLYAIYAILSYGAIYLPLDTDYPDERLSFMLNDSAAKAVFINDKKFELKIDKGLIKLYTAEVIMTSSDFQVNSCFSDPAYIIYTSGTTGTPKGVVIKQESLYDYILTFNELLSVGESDCVLQQSSISFDTSIEELFTTLSLGGSVFVVNHQKDLNKITEAIQTGKPTILSTSPLALNYFNNSIDDFKNIKQILSGGDELKRQYFDKIPHEIKIWNGYGPTESTVCITFLEIDRENTASEITIGKPINNRHVFILDSDMNLSLRGNEGELFVSGIGLAEGYLNLPEISNTKFVDNPFKPGTKLYRTGDKVKWNSDGTISYKGRLDNQIKIRGYRIELDEIDKVIRDLEEIENVYIQVNQVDGSKFLRAYYVVKKGHVLNEADLIRNISEKLPSFMVPSQVIQLDELPMNTNGKIDDKALPSVVLNKQSIETDVSERTADEEILVLSVSKIIGSDFSLNKSFFAQGGDSIKAIQLVNELRANGYSLDVKDVFTSLDLRNVALKMRKEELNIFQNEVVGEYKFSPIQKEFFNFKYTYPDHYNQSVVLEFENQIDSDALEKSFQLIYKHHDNLRSVFYSDYAEIQPYRVDDVKFVSRSKITTEEEFEMVCNQLQSSFSIKTSPLIKAEVIHFKTRNYLAIVAHHLIIDAVSWRIVIEDLLNSYYQILDGKKTLLPLKTHSFLNWTEALQQFSESNEIQSKLEYWENVISSNENNLNFEKPLIKNTQEIEFKLQNDTIDLLLTKANTTYNTKVQDLLLTAFSRAYAKIFNENTILIDLESHGREFVQGMDINRTVGWFTTIYPFRLVASTDISADIVTIKDNLNRVPQNGFSFLLLKQMTDSSDLIRNYNGKILFNYLGEVDSGLNFEGVKLSELSAGENVNDKNPKEYLIEINQKVEKGALITRVSYVNFVSMLNFEKTYIEELKKIVDHCINKDEQEYTASDMSFDISSDDFDNIFGE